MTSELTNHKPCPFCGRSNIEEVDATKTLGVWRLIHRCVVFGYMQIESSDKNRNSYKWNTRHHASEYSNNKEEV